MYSMQGYKCVCYDIIMYNFFKKIKHVNLPRLFSVVLYAQCLGETTIPIVL